MSTVKTSKLRLSFEGGRGDVSWTAPSLKHVLFSPFVYLARVETSPRKEDQEYEPLVVSGGATGAIDRLCLRVRLKSAAANAPKSLGNESSPGEEADCPAFGDRLMMTIRETSDSNHGFLTRSWIAGEALYGYDYYYRLFRQLTQLSMGFKVASLRKSCRASIGPA